MIRLQHIIECVETGEWPVSRTFSAYSVPAGSSIDIDRDSSTPKRDSSTPCSLPDGSEMITITTDHTAGIRNNSSSVPLNQSIYNTNSSLSITPTVQTGVKRKRHIAIDVETERGICFNLL